MKKILFVVFTVVETIILFYGFNLCYPYFLELFETDYNSCTYVFVFGFLFALFIFEIIPNISGTLFLIFRKVRKTLEKQGKE